MLFCIEARTAARRVEFDSERTLRTRNKLHYRVNHWPIWLAVFFVAPGPLVFDLIESGFDTRMAAWLGIVLVGTAAAGLLGKLPGCEPTPYILRFTEDRLNPWYRRICYATAWGEIVAFAGLNVTGLLVAIVTGNWYLEQIYQYGYFPLAGMVWLFGAAGRLPRTRATTSGEGHGRGYFYTSLWGVLGAHALLLPMWKLLPPGRGAWLVMLLAFLGVLAVVAWGARRGVIPRTRPIVPAPFAISD